MSYWKVCAICALNFFRFSVMNDLDKKKKNLTDMFLINLFVYDQLIIYTAISLITKYKYYQLSV